MEQQKKILNSLFDEELQDHSKLRGDEKAEIAQVKFIIYISKNSKVSQQPIEDINKLLRNYEQLLKIHSWLRLTK